MHRVRLPQQAIARQLHISAAYLSQILHGARVPSLAVMVRIEDLTGIPLRAWAEGNHNQDYQTQNAENPRQAA
jgi:transcriptional regulator with XRE-family HTH domain